MREQARTFSPQRPSKLIQQRPCIARTAFLRLKTSHGHVMAEVYSAFQKGIRRGNVDESFYWATQIALPVPEQNYKGYPGALRKRLAQHALEDMCDLPLSDASLTARAGSPFEVYCAVASHCLTPKTHVAAWLNRVGAEYLTEHPQLLGTVPYDSDDPVEFTAMCIAVRARLRDASAGERSRIRAAMQGIVGKVSMRVYTALGGEVLAWIAWKLRNKEFFGEKAELATPVSEIPRPSDIEARARDEFVWDPNKTLAVPDYALDKHTARGKQLGRGYAHFFENMILTPRAYVTDPYEDRAKELYLADEKRFGSRSRSKDAVARMFKDFPDELLDPDGSPYTDPLQVQVLSGRYKSRVWFVKNGGRTRDFVIKGPVAAEEMAGALESDRCKKALGLVDVGMIELSFREKWYLRSDSLVPYDPSKKVWHADTAIESARFISSGAGATWDHKMLSRHDELTAELLCVLLFRKCVGANDTTPRNILVVDGRVASVDDAAHWTPTPMMWKTVTKPAEYASAIRRLWPRVAATITRWADVALPITDDKKKYFTETLRVHAAGPEFWKFDLAKLTDADIDELLG